MPLSKASNSGALSSISTPLQLATSRMSPAFRDRPTLVGKEEVYKQEFTGEACYILILSRQLGLELLFEVLVLGRVWSIDEAILEPLQVARRPKLAVFPEKRSSSDQALIAPFARGAEDP